MGTEEEEVDARVVWLKKKVCLLLLQTKSWSSAEFVCPLKPNEQPSSLLVSFLNQEQKDCLMFFFVPPPEVEEDDSSVGDHLRDPPTAMSSFQWESNDSNDEGAREPNAQPLIPNLHFIDGLPPENLRMGGILVRKAVEGPVKTPSVKDEDDLSVVLQLSFLHKNYRRCLQEVFNQVYSPLYDRLSRQDPTGYLNLLSKGLMRVTNVSWKNSPFVEGDSVEDDGAAFSSHFGMQTSSKEKRKQFVETAVTGEEGSEEEVTVRKDPKEFVLRCLTKLRDKFTKVPESNTLTELKNDWEEQFLDLSNALAFILAHPVVVQMEKESEEAKKKKKRRKKKPRKKEPRGALGTETGGAEGAATEAKEEGDEQTTTTTEGESTAPEDEAGEPAGEESSPTAGTEEEDKAGVKRKKKGKAEKKEKSENWKERKNTEAETALKLKRAVTSLVRLHSELSDCRRALLYLENCFKVVEAGKVEELGGKSLPLLQTLEIVWRVGRRSGISGRVQVLLEASVQSLVDVVTRDLRPVNLLPSSLKEIGPLLAAQKRVDCAETVVSEWENTASTYSLIIKISAKRRKDGRHDFDPGKVVGIIQGLKAVCQDLQQILSELLEVQVVLSSEWSSLVTVARSDPLKVATSQVLKVLTAYDFNIFSPRNRDRWTRQKEDFRRALRDWEQTTQQVLSDSFKNRQTSELVSAVSIVLQKEPCRPLFRDLLLARLPSLMAEFAEEVKHIEEDFLEQCEEARPGCQAPVAGRVRWMSAFLTRKLSAWSVLKDLYAKHKTDASSVAIVEEVGLEVESVRKKVEKVQSDEVVRWIDQVNRDIPILLVSPVLTKEEGAEDNAGWGVELPGELQTIVWEAGQLVQGGFKPPPLALHFSLHYPMLQSAAMRLQINLKEYNYILEVLNPVQKQVLVGELSGTGKVLEAGRRVVTWSPASLTHFSKSCKGVIDHVTGITTKLINISHRLDDFVRVIKTTNLMSLPRASSGSKSSRSLPSFQEYVELCGQNRETQLKTLQETYARFVSTLRSTSLLLITSSDTCPATLSPHLNASPDSANRMKPFLNHWRQNIKNGITEMLVGTMTRLQTTLKGFKGHDGLFRIDAELTPSGSLVLVTPARTLVSLLSLTLGQIVRCAMIFIHWRMDDSGGAFLDKKQAIDEDTLAASSFYQEVSKEQGVHDAIVETQDCFADVVKEVDIELQKWYAYQHIWQRDKPKTVKKFFKKYSTIRQIDDKLRFYKELVENLAESKHHVLCFCIRLNLETLVSQITEHANTWIQLIGESLREIAEERLSAISGQITGVEKSLAVEVDDFESLREVVLAIRQVRTNYSHFTASLQETSVMFHILIVYSIKVDASHLTHIEDLFSKVEKLYPEATAARSRVQEQYSVHQEDTVQRLQRFLEKVDLFDTRFKESGPGAVGADLALGTKLMKVYSLELMNLTNEKERIERDLDMFDLPEIDCRPIPDITDIMSNLSEVYEIYGKLKIVELSWKSLRFATARLTELENDLVDLRVTLEKTPKPTGSDVIEQLQAILERHLLSMKVVASLRHSALEQRHWHYLVEITVGRPNDDEAEVFTKGSVLSVWQVLQMGLSKHPDWVAKCVHAATMEKKVHDRVEEITQFWRSIQVELNTSRRVWFLERVPQLEDTLQHHHLNLKTLQASQFSAPYEGDIKSLSKTLLDVGELLSLWSSIHTNLEVILSRPFARKLPRAEEILSSYRQLLETTRRRPFVSELSTKKAYLQRVAALLRESDAILDEVDAVLTFYKNECPRLYFLKDFDLASLVSHKNPVNYLNNVVTELFNNVSALMIENGEVVGLSSVHGENLVLLESVKIPEGGESVSTGIQELITQTKKSTKVAFEKVLRELKDDPLRASILDSYISSQVQNGWLVWWTADVEEAFSKIEMGNRNALREVYGRVSDSIKTLLKSMNRLVLNQMEFEEELEGPSSKSKSKEYHVTCHVFYFWRKLTTSTNFKVIQSKSPKTSQNLSESRKTWSSALLQDPGSERGPHDTSRDQDLRNELETCQRLQPLLLLLIRCRDVMAALLRQNTRTKSSFLWQIQPRYYMNENNELVLRAMHRQIKYEFEYRGCGMEDYVLTVANEAALIAFLVALASHKPVVLQSRHGLGASGRLSMANYVAHLTGNFLYSVSLNAESSPESIKSCIQGSLLDGYLLLLKYPELAPASTLSFISSTLFHLHYSHSHPDSPGIIQIGKEDVVTHPSVGFLFLPMSPEDCGRQIGSAPFPSALLSVCQPVPLCRPTFKELLYAFLLANNAPEPYHLCNSLYEVVRHYESPESGPLPLYTRHLKILLKELLPCFVVEPEIFLDLAIQTCSDVLECWLSELGTSHRASVYKQLVPMDKALKDYVRGPRGEEMDNEMLDKEILFALKAMKSVLIEHQVPLVKKLVQEFHTCKGGSIIVSGPPFSGKATAVELACRVLVKINESSLFGKKDSRDIVASREREDGKETTLDEGPPQDLVLENRNKEDKMIYFLSCDSYDEFTLFGSDKKPGLIPSLVGRLTTNGSDKQRFIVLKGHNAGQTFLRVRQPLADNYGSLTFVIEASSLIDVPECVRARSSILQLDGEVVSPNDLLSAGGGRGRKGHERDSSKDDEDEEQVFVDYREEAEVEKDREKGAGDHKGLGGRGKKEQTFKKSAEEEMNTSSIFHFLLEPFFDLISQQKLTILPYSPMSMITQCQAILDGLTKASERPSSRERKTLYSYHEEHKQRDSLILILDSILRTFASLFKDEFKLQLNEALRPKIKNLIQLKTFRAAEQKGIERLLATTSPLSDFYWIPEEDDWIELKYNEEEEDEELPETPTGSVTGSATKPETSEPSSVADEEESMISLEKRLSTTEEVEKDTFIDPVEVETTKLRNSLLPLMKNGKPLLVVGPKGLKKTVSVMKILKELENVNTLLIRLTPHTNTRDLERALLSSLTRTAIDAVETSPPTVFVISNFEKASVKFELLSYIESLCLRQGFYHPSLDYRWTIAKNIYIICIASHPIYNLTEEREAWSHLRAFSMHSFTTQIRVCKRFLKLHLFSSLEQNVADPLLKATFRFIQVVQSLVDLQLEVFSPACEGSKIGRLSKVFGFLLASMIRSNFETSSSFPPSTDTETPAVHCAWYLSLLKEFIWPILNFEIRERMLGAFKEIIAEDFDLKFLNEIESPTPLWVKKNKSPLETPTKRDVPLPRFMLHFQTNPAKIFATLKQETCWEDTKSPPELDHSGIAEGVLRVVSLLVVGTECLSLPLLLVVCPPTSDLFIILRIAAKYLEKELVTCRTEEESISIFEKLSTDEGSSKEEVSSGKSLLIHLTCKFLHSLAVEKSLHELSSHIHRRKNSRNKLVVILTGSEEDAEDFADNLEALFGGGSSVLRLHLFTSQEHSNFVRNNFQKMDTEDTWLDEHEDKIVNFLVTVHQSVIEETLRKRSLSTDYDNPSLSYNYPLPSVNMLVLSLQIFSESLKEKTKSSKDEIHDLQLAIERSQSLDAYLAQMRATHTEITTDIETTTQLIASVQQDVEKKRVQMGCEETELENLRQELSSAVAAEEELVAEVSEYEEETRKPLVSIYHELVNVNMERVKKLVTFSPVMAVQLVFESAVTLLGTGETTWKEVRQATNDVSFCKNVAALDIPSLSESQVASVVARLSQIKISEPHMARMSEIAGILFRYLKKAMFLWRRFHDDIQPRWERVDAMKSNTQELRTKIADAEVSIQGIRQGLQDNSSRLKKEEERIGGLNELKQSLEADLKEVGSVIQGLSPHVHSWKERLARLEEASNRLLEKCLMDAVQKSYLAPIPAQMRAIFQALWCQSLQIENDFQTETKMDENRTSLFISGLDGSISTILAHQRASSSTYLIIKDLHNQQETYFANCRRFNLGSNNWQSFLSESTDGGESTLEILLQGHHSKILQSIDWIESSGWRNIDTNTEERESKRKLPFIVFALEDECYHQPCFLCSNYLLLDLSLSDAEMENLFCRTFLKNFGNGGAKTDENLRVLLKQHDEVKSRRKIHRQEFMASLIQCDDLKSSSFLACVSQQANSLDLILEKETNLKKELIDSAEGIRQHVLDASKYGVQIHHVLSLLRRLSRHCPIHVKALTESFAKIGRQFWAQTNFQALSDTVLRSIIKEATTNLLKPRISSGNRLIVGAALAFLSLPRHVDHKRVVRTFLEPLEEEGDVWKPLLDLETDMMTPKWVNEDTKLDNREWKKRMANIKFGKMSFTESQEEKEDTESEEKTTKTQESEDVVEEDKSQKSSGEDKSLLQPDSNEVMKEKIHLKFTRIREACGSFFSNFDEPAEKNLVEWVEGKDHRLNIPQPDDETHLITTVQKAMLARHLRPHSLPDLLRDVVKEASLEDILSSCQFPLAEVVQQCPLFSLRSVKHQENLVMIVFKGSMRLDLFVRSTASKVGVKQYKITHVSLPSLSDEELRIHALKSSRRRTWLVINDCYMIPDGLQRVRDVLSSLPDEAAPPTVFCSIPEVEEVRYALHQPKIINNGEVFVCLEGSRDFHLSLKSLQILSQTYPRNGNEVSENGYITFAAVAFVHSLICARQNYVSSGWISRVFAADEDFKSAVEMATFYVCEAGGDEGAVPADEISWGAVTGGLTKVIYRNVTPHVGDLNLINTLLRGYLSPNLLHPDLEAIESWIQDKQKKYDYELFKEACTAPSVDDELIARIESREESFLHLDKAEYNDHQRCVILDHLHLYAETNLMSVPLNIVKVSILLLTMLTSGSLLSFLEVSERQRDFETLAWEQEINTWEELRDTVKDHIQQLLQASSERYITPCMMLLSLSRLVERINSASANNQSATSQGSLIGENVSHKKRKFMGKKNLIQREMATKYVSCFVKTFEGLKERRDQLQYWGIYLIGCQLMGGVWSDDKIFPRNENHSVLTLILTVSHSKPVPTSSQIWVPVVDPESKHKILVEALMPIDSSFKQSTELLHIVLT